MHTYKILSELLAYPENKIDVLEHYKNIFMFENAGNGKFNEFCRWYDEYELQSLQEEYVATFDISKTITLNLFEYAYGKSPNRGPAMAELIDTYRSAGFVLMDEMPDYLPVFLEFAAEAGTRCLEPVMPALLGALEKLTARLEEAGSKYAILTGIAASLFYKDFATYTKKAEGI